MLPSTFQVVSHSTITATVPGNLRAGSYEILVQTPSGFSGPALSPGSDLLRIGPTITSINPNAGPVPGGTAGTITGTCFDSPGLNPNNVQVYFGSTLGSKGYDQCASSMQCVVYSPAATGVSLVDVVVSVDGANSPATSADQFTYAGPQISSVTPNHQPKTGGTALIINGAGFPPFTRNRRE